MKLNLGSGSKRYEGWTNVDQDIGSDPDYVVNLELDCLPFEDNSVTEVKAHHVLEHLGEGFFHCIQEIYRVCEHGAIIDIHVPHPRHDTFLIDPTHKRPILPDTMGMFSRKRNKLDIERGGCETPLGFIYGIDLEFVNLNYVLDGYFQQMFKTLTQEQCEHVVRTCNNVILEIQIKMVVVKDESSGNR
jgi:ubiquinone/menaquinone biosynthesis C-methylase UbiE